MNSNSVFITLATLSDAKEIVSLVNSAYRGDSARLGWTHEADLLGGTRIELQALNSEIENPRKSILCFRKSESGAILGTVNLEWIDEDPLKGKGCYLGMLTTEPKLQGQGIGKTLLQESESFARAREVRYLILGVIQTRTELIAWYERRGYRKSGLTKPFPYDHPSVENPTRMDLFFVFMEKELHG